MAKIQVPLHGSFNAENEHWTWTVSSMRADAPTAPQSAVFHSASKTIIMDYNPANAHMGTKGYVFTSGGQDLGFGELMKHSAALYAAGDSMGAAIKAASAQAPAANKAKEKLAKAENYKRPESEKDLGKTRDITLGEEKTKKSEKKLKKGSRADKEPGGYKTVYNGREIKEEWEGPVPKTDAEGRVLAQNSEPSSASGSHHHGHHHSHHHERRRDKHLTHNERRRRDHRNHIDCPPGKAATHGHTAASTLSRHTRRVAKLDAAHQPLFSPLLIPAYAARANFEAIKATAGAVGTASSLIKSGVISEVGRAAIDAMDSYAKSESADLGIKIPKLGIKLPTLK